MKSKNTVIQKQWEEEEVNDLIVDGIQDIKGKNIIKLDLRNIEDAPSDYFIICEGDSNTQVKAIAENVKIRLKDETGMIPSSMEGMESSHWILLDYFNVVVHIFYRETRSFYDLESLWNDAKMVEYETL